MNCEHKDKTQDICEVCGGIYTGCNDCGELLMACGCYFSEWAIRPNDPFNIEIEKLMAENTELREALEINLVYFDGNWAAANNHPASHCANQGVFND